ncbi:hypothetical protein L1987_22055 [Smallanthus sonchifolius]|uniref:Uncharacterized protein n=1 Tax=Smallanthus sonchifolius TaxID=185202 RepID=A0ACB9IFA5_9ASTR|nr:hypothetical protein L1987_22055 [Smallanthus sonchifolius]
MADAEAEQWRPEVVEEAEAVVIGELITTVNVLDVTDILKFDDDVDGTTNEKDEILYESNASQVETGERSNKVGEVVEEEIVELEFEKVKPKLATHSMHCPNCKSKITKVILRRKVLSYRPNEQPVDPVEPEPEQRDLVGCFSCLSLFTCSENGCFNPFDIFLRRSETSTDHASSSSGEHKMKAVVRENVTFQLLSADLPESSNATGDDDAMITIENEPETIVVARSRGRSWIGYEGVLVEIIKSIVYGGLMEVIASLSVVALLLLLMPLHLWDLRDDCYKDSSSRETNKAATNKYKDLLGQVNYFPLHAFFAIISFLMFGMVPPVAYGYSCHETNDKDFTLVVTATASLLCVLLLAILKAYINKCTVFEYFKTVVYYIITAVLVSGVSYVVGNLVARLMEELGWFNTSSGGGMPCLPRATNPYLESF